AADMVSRCIRPAQTITIRKLRCKIIAWHAMRITKDQQYPLASILRECDGTPVYIGQGEIRGNTAALQTVTLIPTLTEWFHACAATDGISYLHSRHILGRRCRSVNGLEEASPPKTVDRCIL